MAPLRLLPETGAAVGGLDAVGHAINILQTEVPRMAMPGISWLEELDRGRFLRRVEGR